jgi:hypothetical protein
LQLLARERCACLALAYHARRGRSRTWIEVPLERPERALRWLRDYPRARRATGASA